jgi:hypothetical protein
VQIIWSEMCIEAKDSSNNLVAGSLRNFSQESRNVEFSNELCKVKTMIRRTGAFFMASPYSQTLNRHDYLLLSKNPSPMRRNRITIENRTNS